MQLFHELLGEKNVIQTQNFSTSKKCNHTFKRLLILTWREGVFGTLLPKCYFPLVAYLTITVRCNTKLGYFTTLARSQTSSVSILSSNSLPPPLASNNSNRHPPPSFGVPFFERFSIVNESLLTFHKWEDAPSRMPWNVQMSPAFKGNVIIRNPVVWLHAVELELGIGFSISTDFAWASPGKCVCGGEGGGLCHCLDQGWRTF